MSKKRPRVDLGGRIEMMTRGEGEEIGADLAVGTQIVGTDTDGEDTMRTGIDTVGMREIEVERVTEDGARTAVETEERMASAGMTVKVGEAAAEAATDGKEKEIEGRGVTGQDLEVIHADRLRRATIN
jgi:hypothetical protein